MVTQLVLVLVLVLPAPSFSPFIHFDNQMDMCFPMEIKALRELIIPRAAGRPRYITPN